MRFLATKPSFPLEVEWSITWGCNVACVFCSTARYDPRELARNVELVLQRIIECRPLCTTLSGGEPLTHPRIDYITEKLVGSGIAVNLTTNGILLSPAELPSGLIEKFNWIRVSVHSADEQVAKTIMGARYSADRVFQNMEEVLPINSNLSAFALITRRNCHEQHFARLIGRLSRIGVRQLSVGMTKLLGRASIDQLPPINRVRELIEFIREEAAKTSIEVHLPEISGTRHWCSSSKTSISIWPDGTIRTCSFEHEESIGHVDESSLTEVWNTKHNAPSFCNKCRPGGYFNDAKIEH